MPFTGSEQGCACPDSELINCLLHKRRVEPRRTEPEHSCELYLSPRYDRWARHKECAWQPYSRRHTQMAIWYL